MTMIIVGAALVAVALFLWVYFHILNPLTHPNDSRFRDVMFAVASACLLVGMLMIAFNLGSLSRG